MVRTQVTLDAVGLDDVVYLDHGGVADVVEHVGHDADRRFPEKRY